MKIVLTLTFDTAEELEQYLAGRGLKKAKQPKTDLVPMEDVVEAIKAEKAEKPAPKAEKPAPEPEAKKAEAEPAPEIDESYRVEVRKVLAALNKKTGENTASKLIKELGKDKLTEVALSDLPALMAKAKEQIDA